MSLVIEESYAPDGSKLFTIASAEVESTVPIDLADLIAALIAVCERLSALRLSGMEATRIKVMVQPNLRMALTLSYGRANNDVVGVPAPDQSTLGAHSMRRQAEQVIERLRQAIYLAHAQGQRIVDRPDMLQSAWSAGFTASQLGVDARSLITQVRKQPPMEIDVGGEPFSVGGVKGMPWHLPTGTFATEKRLVPIVVDARLWTVEFSTLIEGDQVAASLDPADFKLVPPRGRPKISASVDSNQPEVLFLLQAASAVQAAVDVRFARYGATTGGGDRLVVVEVLNASATAKLTSQLVVQRLEKIARRAQADAVAGPK